MTKPITPIESARSFIAPSQTTTPSWDGIWQSLGPIFKTTAVQLLQKRTFLGILSPRFRELTNCPLYIGRKRVLDDGSRLDHTVAVSQLALQICLQVNLPLETCRYAAAWGLVHDIATWPLSHTGEAAFSITTGVGSRELREMMIRGNSNLPSMFTINDELKEAGIDIDILLSLFDKKSSPKTLDLAILWQIVNSPLTPDSLEGIWRCARSFKVHVRKPQAWVHSFKAGLFQPSVQKHNDATQFWQKKSFVYSEFINRDDVIFFESAWSHAIRQVFGSLSLAETLLLDESEMISNILDRGVTPICRVIRYKSPHSYSVTSARRLPQELWLDQLNRLYVKSEKE